jgi:hypothetical protein
MRSRISVFECEIHRLWKTSSIVSLPVTSEKAQHCSFFHATTEQFRAESIKSAVSRVDDQHTSAQSIVDGGEDRNHDCWYYKIRGEYPRLQPRDESDNSSATTADGWMGYSTVLKHQALILNNYKLLYRRSECWKSTEPIKRRSATTHR